MDREEIKQLIVGPMATVPTPFDDDFEVDYAKMRDLTQWWVENGLVKGKAVIKVAATMGEGPQLRDDEWPTLLRTAARAAEDKAAIVCGLHYKDTIRAVEDAKKAQDNGAIGLQISPPIFNAPTQDDTLRHFEDISNAIDIGILAYPVWYLSWGGIHLETFRRMVDFEQVVGIKWYAPEPGTYKMPFTTSPDPIIKYEDIFELADIVNIIDNAGTPILNHRLGGKGYINHTSDIYPPHDLKLWELMESGRYDEADALWESAEVPWRKFANKVSQRTGGQAVVKKGMLAVMGHPPGASRPPSLPLTAEELAELYEMMAGWGWPVAEKAAVLGSK